VPELAQPWLGTLSPPVLLLLGGVALVFLGFCWIVLWLLLGRGPRRARAFRRAQRLLRQGAWQEALARIQDLQARGRLSPQWQGKLRNAEGECQRTAGDLALQEKRFEEGLQHFEKAAALLGLSAAEQRERVLEAMLAEVRKLFAAGDEKDLSALLALVARLLQLQSPCAEASFWQGLAYLKRGQTDAALTQLTAAHQAASQRFLDPPLYIGGLLLRKERPQEALRFLSEANRVDGSCPLVVWQLGMALVAAGGESRVASQALQRALGPRGLGLWVQDRDKMQRLWVEAFPETRSFVRRLALKHPFLCPLFGNDVAAMIREGQLALAQALYRLGQFQEAADLYGKLLQESPPSLPLLRGLGLSLARLERYDQAYKYLRMALDQDPRHHLTAGYLALCGSLGKPTQADDKPRNVTWAIRLLARFPVTGDPEWARIASAVFAEARALGLPLGIEDQLRLCNLLASVQATDPAAAAAYDHLAATFADWVRPEYAWLYCRAAQQHGFAGQRDLDLFARTFHTEAVEGARAFFRERGWDLDEVEYVYLERCAAQRPGRFPAEAGPDYPARAEANLLQRSALREAAGQKDVAIAAVEVLLKLAPRSPAAHDRLAHLYYRRGDLERAVTLLETWQQLQPNSPWPVVRGALLAQQVGDADARSQAIRHAMTLTHGRLRAAIAFLGARLALAPTPDWADAQALLLDCVRDDPEHVEGRWFLAAARLMLGDWPSLAAQARMMDQPAVPDPRFHYLAAVCHLAAGEPARTLEAARRAAVDPALAADSHYLMGWAHLRLGDVLAAHAALEKAAAEGEGASAAQASALLGKIEFEHGSPDAAIAWWQALDPKARGAWHLDEALRATVFLSGLAAYGEERFQDAAERFREAGRLGYRDRRLGALLALALFKAGQRLLYQVNTNGSAASASPLVATGGLSPDLTGRPS
jgi:tetratricopeptide (TPR) repeat protein